MPGAVAGLYENLDSLPCADFRSLGPRKRSPEYAATRRRVADLKPVDAWQVNMLHYFVFQPRPPEETPAEAAAAFARFTLLWEENEPGSAVVITPIPGGEQAEVMSLREPGATHTVPLGRE